MARDLLTVQDASARPARPFSSQLQGAKTDNSMLMIYHFWCFPARLSFEKVGPGLKHLQTTGLSDKGKKCKK